MSCSKMVPEWLIIDFIPKIEILFQNLALEITFSEFFYDGHFGNRGHHSDGFLDFISKIHDFE